MWVARWRKLTAERHSEHCEFGQLQARNLSNQAHAISTIYSTTERGRGPRSEEAAKSAGLRTRPAAAYERQKPGNWNFYYLSNYRNRAGTS